MLQRFVTFSAEITAFSPFELFGTGQAEAYLHTLVDVLGPALVEELLMAHGEITNDAGDDPDLHEQALRRRIFGDEKLGPIARNVIKLWYVGIWYQLPRAWSDAHGPLPRDVTFTVSPRAYVEGLLWTALGSNPPGAKAPGYGSWAEPPRIPAIPTSRRRLTIVTPALPPTPAPALDIPLPAPSLDIPLPAPSLNGQSPDSPAQ